MLKKAKQKKGMALLVPGRAKARTVAGLRKLHFISLIVSVKGQKRRQE